MIATMTVNATTAPNPTANFRATLRFFILLSTTSHDRTVTAIGSGWESCSGAKELFVYPMNGSSKPSYPSEVAPVEQIQ